MSRGEKIGRNEQDRKFVKETRQDGSRVYLASQKGVWLGRGRGSGGN